MGLFSKKEYVCEKCGKTFMARMYDTTCPECKLQDKVDRRRQLEQENEERTRQLKQEKEEKRQKEEKYYQDYKRASEEIPGYVRLSADLWIYQIPSIFDPYDQVDAIIAHKDAIIEKYSKNGMLPDMLSLVRENYEKLSHEEALNVYLRCRINSAYSLLTGMLYTRDCIFSTHYDGVILENKDIFAVAYSTDRTIRTGAHREAIMVYIFSNDPFVPIITGVSIVQVDKGSMNNPYIRDAIKLNFKNICPNLQYPIVELSEFQQMILNDGAVKGSLSLEYMKNQLKKAMSGSGMYSGKELLENAGLDILTYRNMMKMGVEQKGIVDAAFNDEKCRDFWRPIDKEASVLFAVDLQDLQEA